MSLRKYLIVPKLLSLVAFAPRDRAKAWDTFWGRVRRTGEGGEVLWDIESELEWKTTLEKLEAHLDEKAPILDVGCGNGRHTRKLAEHFSAAIGVDISRNAILRARDESTGSANLDYRVVDMAAPAAGKRLAGELGEMNVFVRGVLHVIPHEERVVLIENLWDVLGTRGALYLVESDFQGDPLEHLVFQGATPTEFPEPLRLGIASGLRPPEHFSRRELDQYFPAGRWERIASGPTFLHTLPMTNRSRGMDELAALYAVLRPRRGA